jgi:hypothetical protein
MATYKYLGDRNADGIVIGYSSSEPIAFWGATPAARTAFTAAAAATTVAVSTTTGAITSWGFSTSTQANAVISLVNEIRAALVTLGLKA